MPPENAIATNTPALVEILSYQQRLLSEQDELIYGIQEKIVNLRDLRSPVKSIPDQGNKTERSGLLEQFVNNNEHIVNNCDRLRDILTQMQQMF